MPRAFQSSISVLGLGVSLSMDPYKWSFGFLQISRIPGLKSHLFSNQVKCLHLAVLVSRAWMSSVWLKPLNL